MNQRQQFLSLFLRGLGAEEIEWTEITDEFIAGTVIYEQMDPEEVQDFKWTITEAESPDNETRILMEYILKENLLDIDRLKKTVEDIEVPGLTDHQKRSTFDKLFAVRVRMVDEGEETDSYFIHE